jgi:sugar/nucleoside kinase (ribokinase family)
MTKHQAPASIDYLILGHVAHDRTPQGPQLGGTVAYTALTVRALGLRVGVVTSARPADPVLAGLSGVDVHLLPAAESTIFVNTYTPEGRTQAVEGHARVLSLADVPAAWRTAPIVHLGPIARELDATLTPEAFPSALVGITPQGYMRAWGDDGRVRPVPWAGASAMLPQAVTILSDEDLGFDPGLEATYARQARALVVTRSHRGATLYRGGRRQDFPAPRIAELVHPTGAGDVFAGALLASLRRRPEDWVGAMQTAVTVASAFVARCSDPGAPSLESMQAIVTDRRVREVLHFEA